MEKVEDETTKNHKETNYEVQTGFMPQMVNSNGKPHKLYPVRSFENYLGHLNPKIPNLWQTPVQNLIDLPQQVRYQAEAIGHNPIEKFAGKLSKICELSQKYTCSEIDYEF